MHKSRLAAFIIDCRTDDLDAAATFWAQALGRSLLPPHRDYPTYRGLERSPSEPMLAVQQVEHDSRIHLDVETDDLEPEVARLELLGARRLQAVRDWIVMEAPTGQRFCVVPPQRGELALRVSRWPSAMKPPAPPPSPEHERLSSLVGRWGGRTRLWLDPAKPPQEGDGELRIEAVLGGRWLRFEEHGFAAGQSHAGEMLLGFQREPAEYQASWIDTFHTAGAILFSTGAPRADGIIAVTGSYAAGPERWGWRTEIEPLPEGTLILRAVNIAPNGAEYPALETRWRR